MASLANGMIHHDAIINNDKIIKHVIQTLKHLHIYKNLYKSEIEKKLGTQLSDNQLEKVLIYSLKRMFKLKKLDHFAERIISMYQSFLQKYGDNFDFKNFTEEDMEGFINYSIEVRKAKQETRAKKRDEAENNDIDAKYNLARKLLNGVGYDILLGANWCRLVAEQGHRDAQYSMGILYETGFGGVRPDNKKALEFYTYAAIQGHIESQFIIASIYRKGSHGETQDYEKAIFWLKEAADKNHLSALNNLAMMYRNGEGVNKNPKLAVELFERAANQGFAPSETTLASMYEQGIFVPKNEKKAFELYNRAMEHGLEHRAEQPVRYCIAGLYAKGGGVQQDLKKAVEIYQDLANQGYELAYNQIAQLYLEGRGLPQSDRMAFEWYMKTALKDDSIAQNKIGTFYLHGTGIEQNYEKALYWYQLAARNGSSSAFYHLGLMYEHGQGVQQNFEIAIDYYKIAISKDLPIAHIALNNLLSLQENETNGISKSKTKNRP